LYFSWDLSYQIEPKETVDTPQCNEQFLRTYGAHPLKAYVFHQLILKKMYFLFIFSLIHRFPSEISLESLGSSNTNTNENTGSTIISGSSIHSTSSTSLDKISTTSNNSLQQQQQLHLSKIPHIHHARSSSASSYLTSSNDSPSQNHVLATASPTITTSNYTANSDENESVIAKVHLAGKADLLYKKVRVSL